MSQSTSGGATRSGAGERVVGPSANAALALSMSAVVIWLAAMAADELYMLMAVLAVAGLAQGVRVRRAHGPHAPGNGRALAAIITGGVLVTLFLAFLGVAFVTGDI